MNRSKTCARKLLYSQWYFDLSEIETSNTFVSITTLNLASFIEPSVHIFVAKTFLVPYLIC